LVPLESLDELLVAAGEAPPESRIEFRDRIAAFGSVAIDRLMTSPWIGDPKYASFAVLTIRKAGELGVQKHAVRALRDALAAAVTDTLRGDISAALLALGASPSKSKRNPKKTPSVRSFALALADLIEGRCYTRTELHDSLGGNRQKGISYPAEGDHCLLFSDPLMASAHGYADAPVGDDGYRYFGEWSGTGDMTMTGGNQMILDRSPELYLFTRATCGHIFRGRFQCGDWETEKATRDGKSHAAIVFNLHRA
jgi:hypothetical protein